MPQASLADWTNSMVVLMATLTLMIMPTVILLQRFRRDRPLANVRVIQLLALVMIIPAIIIFGMTGKMEPATIGTLLAALAGMFSGIAGDSVRPKRKADPSGEVDEDEAQKPTKKSLKDEI